MPKLNRAWAMVNYSEGSSRFAAMPSPSYVVYWVKMLCREKYVESKGDCEDLFAAINPATFPQNERGIMFCISGPETVAMKIAFAVPAWWLQSILERHYLSKLNAENVGRIITNALLPQVFADG